MVYAAQKQSQFHTGLWPAISADGLTYIYQEAKRTGGVMTLVRADKLSSACSGMDLARPTRFERVTPAFGGRYSIQLSYGRK